MRRGRGAHEAVGDRFRLFASSPASQPSLGARCGRPVLAGTGEEVWPAKMGLDGSQPIGLSSESVAIGVVIMAGTEMITTLLRVSRLAQAALLHDHCAMAFVFANSRVVCTHMVEDAVLDEESCGAGAPGLKPNALVVVVCRGAGARPLSAAVWRRAFALAVAVVVVLLEATGDEEARPVGHSSYF